MIVGIGSALKGFDEEVGIYRSPTIPLKMFNNKKYHAWISCDTKLAATTIANRVRKMGYLARVGKHDVDNRTYTVWISE